MNLSIVLFEPFVNSDVGSVSLWCFHCEKSARPRAGKHLGNPAMAMIRRRAQIGLRVHTLRC